VIFREYGSGHGGPWLKMSGLIGPFTFWLYKNVVLPWKRTPVAWSAIIFNGSGQFAVFTGPKGHRLPAGEIGPNQTVGACGEALGLDKSDFSSTRPFHLIHIVGRGREGFTFYFSGEIVEDDEAAKQFLQDVVFLPQSMLKSFVPAEIEEKLI
jgi:hypothetical protein